MTNEEKHDDPIEVRRPDHRGNHPTTPQLMRNVFGIFMIIVYIGMGVLLFINFFRWDSSFTWVRYVGGVLFTLYGIWRGYRQFKGIDSNI
ncbi:MAG: hypothetical protein NC301_01265 [Bacteroides sp.]|nr:hypothetical protein [Bacteroides sp.]MCM1378759.1 hypothetical protein [Bacteroides sp.]MCM1445376.1 hypothetical protein [Prevotella sp.]